ncbi:hypothetical protein EDB80DRAFT_221527 [Ilyonectria destructans]|nr:hypothetical protein EDB80DRAFT_221527 [Ilyonectria destructans]
MNTLISSSILLGLLSSIIDLLARGALKATPYYSTTIGLALVVVVGKYLDTISRRSASEDLIKVCNPLLDTQFTKMHPTGQLVPSTFLRPGDQIIITHFSVSNDWSNKKADLWNYVCAVEEQSVTIPSAEPYSPLESSIWKLRGPSPSP